MVQAAIRQALLSDNSLNCTRSSTSLPLQSLADSCKGTRQHGLATMKFCCRGAAGPWCGPTHSQHLQSSKNPHVLSGLSCNLKIPRIVRKQQTKCLKLLSCITRKDTLPYKAAYPLTHSAAELWQLQVVKSHNLATSGHTAHTKHPSTTSSILYKFDSCSPPAILLQYWSQYWQRCRLHNGTHALCNGVQRTSWSS